MPKADAEKSENFTLRLDVKLRKQLEKEASQERRTLGAYIKLLLETHPARTKLK